MKKSKRIIAVIAFFAVLSMSLSACFGESKNNEDINNSVSDTEETIKNDDKAPDAEEIVENDEKAQVRFQDRRIEEEHPELVELLDMTAGEIKEKYGEFEFEYSEFGPGLPVYSIENFPGVLVGFEFNIMNEELSDDIKPNRVKVYNEYTGGIMGLGFRDKVDELEQPIIWDKVVYILSEGTFYVEARLGDYVLDVYLNHENFGALNMPREDVATEEEWNIWKDNFSKNATGRVGSFCIKKYEEEIYSCEEPDLEKPLVAADLSSYYHTVGNYYPELDTALFSAAPLGEESAVYVLNKGLVYYVSDIQSEGSYYRCNLNLPDCYNGSIVYVSAGAGSGELTFIVEAESCIDKAYFEYVFLFEKDSLINSILTPIHVSRLSEKPSFIE